MNIQWIYTRKRYSYLLLEKKEFSILHPLLLLWESAKKSRASFSRERGLNYVLTNWLLLIPFSGTNQCMRKGTAQQCDELQCRKHCLTGKRGVYHLQGQRRRKLLFWCACLSPRNVYVYFSPECCEPNPDNEAHSIQEWELNKISWKNTWKSICYYTKNHQQTSCAAVWICIV